MSKAAPGLGNSGISRLVGWLNETFQVSQRGSSLRTEIFAGLTTFSTMSYVLVVHPLVLSTAGMDRGALITATAVVAVTAPRAQLLFCYAQPSNISAGEAATTEELSSDGVGSDRVRPASAAISGSTARFGGTKAVVRGAKKGTRAWATSPGV